MARTQEPTGAISAGHPVTPSGGGSGRPSSVRRILPLRARPSRLWLILASLGPGLIAANAGNDAGGIVTYASVGSQYGYGLLWAFPLILISLAVVQEMAARMGAATGKGLSDLIRENFPIHATFVVLLALLIANGATVVSEFVGISAALGVILPPEAQYIGVPLIALALWLVVVQGSRASVEKVFLTMTVVFFAYPISALLAHPNWKDVARQTVLPQFHISQPYIFTFVALVGTSITPYMQVFIQSSVADKGITPRDYQGERIEVYLASFLANLVAAFIVIATAATLFVHHPQPLNTAEQAAQALGPLAHGYAKLLFATGLFGASMLAAAVLPLATAFSISEALGVEKGLNASFREAPVFMGIFTGLIVIGVVVALIPGLPVIQVLLLVQVIDCMLLPFVLFAILRLVNDRRLMGDMANGPVYNLIAWATTLVVSGLSVTLLVTTILPIFGIKVG